MDERERNGRWAAVLWDLDGTIADTEPVWLEVEHALADSTGRTWTEEDGLALVGNSLIDSGEYLRSRLGLEMTAHEVASLLVERVAVRLEDGIVWRPGAVELVHALHERGTPQALVTMSWRAIADQVAGRLPFDTSVAGDEVSDGKPHPECYLTAAERLGVQPADCLAIEDSRTGAAAASAAGCHVLVVPHYVNVPEAPRRVQRSSLGGMSPADLDALFA